MNRLLTVAVVLLFSSLIVASIALPAPAAGETKYKISGYILDSNGRTIAGAMVIFNVPQIVPSDTSDATGYYEMLAPAGTYHVNVWPPYDSSYISYDEAGFVVSSDMNKNITLQSGYKICGYVTNSSGVRVSGASVFLGNYGSGYFTNYAGYYFLSVPAGTYTLTVRAGSQSGFDFPTYYEYNYAVSGPAAKNITVGGNATPTPSPTPPSDKFKVSGYVLDSNGHGVAGANVIFNVPQIVPSVYTDSSGYYQMFAPAGTYHINVWPPYDSNYINYDEAAFTVNSGVTKNITLNSGCKVYGYITDTQGTPMVGAVVALNNYLSGWFTKSDGYYFLNVPAGTYTLDAHPRIGTYSSPTSSFTTYYEYNFAVNGNTYKNITVTSQASTPNPTSNPQPTTNPTQNPQPTQHPTPTPTPTLPPSAITITTDASSYQVGQTLNVKGKLTDANGNPLGDKTVVLSYALGNQASWFEVASDNTDAAGEYSIQWLIEGSGTFNLKTQWAGNTQYAGSEKTTTLSFLPYEDQKVFFVESNSTVTGLDFNSDTFELGFTVSGETETEGYTKATIAKTLVANFTAFTVSLDGRRIDCAVTSSENYWIISFNYRHSTHQITIEPTSEAQLKQESIDSTIILAASATIITIVVIITALLGIAVLRKSHKRYS